jgi:hypothetical protein
VDLGHLVGPPEGITSFMAARPTLVAFKKYGFTYRRKPVGFYGFHKNQSVEFEIFKN